MENFGILEKLKSRKKMFEEYIRRNKDQAGRQGTKKKEVK